MSIPPRRAEPEQIASNTRTFFVTSSTWDKRNLLQSDRAAGLFLKVLYEYRAQGKFRLHEFVVMSDHFHLLPNAGGVALYLGNKRTADGMVPEQERRITSGERYQDSVEVWAREEYEAAMEHYLMLAEMAPESERVLTGGLEVARKISHPARARFERELERLDA